MKKFMYEDEEVIVEIEVQDNGATSPGIKIQHKKDARVAIWVGSGIIPSLHIRFPHECSVTKDDKCRRDYSSSGYVINVTPPEKTQD